MLNPFIVASKHCNIQIILHPNIAVTKHCTLLHTYNVAIQTLLHPKTIATYYIQTLLQVIAFKHCCNLLHPNIVATYYIQTLLNLLHPNLAASKRRNFMNKNIVDNLNGMSHPSPSNNPDRIIKISFVLASHALGRITISGNN